MRIVVALSLVLAIGSHFASFAASAEPTATEVLAKYYAHYKIGWPEAHEAVDAKSPANTPLALLFSDDPAAQARGARQLEELCDRTLRDETAKIVPTRNIASGPTNAGRELRQKIGQSLVEKTPPPAALPIVAWLLSHEPLFEVERQAVQALSAIETPAADALRRELLLRPHPNARVMVSLLEQAAKRKLTLPPETTAALCQHYRQSIRHAARALVASQGGPEPPAFDPVRAMQSPAVVKLLEAIGDARLEPLPADGKYVKVTQDRLNAEGQWEFLTDSYSVILKDDGTHFELVSIYGSRHRVSKSPTTRKDEHSTYRTTVAFCEYADEVAQIERERKEKHPSGEPRSRTSSYDFALAQWHASQGRYELAARIFLPAIDDLDRDEFAVAWISDVSGRDAGYRMLIAFAGNRDYAEAEKYARLIVDRFPGTDFHDTAVKLAEQLPRPAKPL